jgi:transcriptional regulator with XRE-family HTH domain
MLNFAAMAFRRDRFRQLREKFGSREKFAEAVKSTSTTIYNIEATESEPGLSLIERSAKALGTTVAYLMGETDNPSIDALKPENFHLSMGNAELADPDLMILLEQELAVIRKLRIEKEKQIRPNTRGDKDRSSGA